MNGLQTIAANALWYALCLPESLRFHAGVNRVADIQRQLLLDLLQRNAGTEYGRTHGFASIRSVAEFQSRVPLTDYDDYQGFIERVAAGEPRVLTADPVLLLEPTSGSTAATKLIPYTASLRSEFQRAIATWIVDLYSHDRRILSGEAYWSVTPVMRHERRTGGGVPIGFDEEGEYLGRWQRATVNWIMAVPPIVKSIDEMESFRYVTLLFLLRSRRLALISIWNPTFLTLLVGRLVEWGQALARDIAGGTITAPAPLDANVMATLRASMRPDARRAAEVAAACDAVREAGGLCARLWPNLRVISCWTDAHAALHVDELARLFPQARVQGKGLLATEGCVSFPLIGHQNAALAFRSHLFEFLPAEDENGATNSVVPALAHELTKGQRYSVVITTGGGLYRYRLHDVIEVTGHLGDCPLIRFTGKRDHVSDWFGEKLNDMHVELAMATAFARHLVTPVFAMLACETEHGRPAYSLFIETTGRPPEVLLSVARAIDATLQENFHYRYCRDLGQLGPLRVFRIESGAPGSYLSACQARGQRAGDIKPVALHHLDGWSKVFRGVFVTE